MQSRVSYPARTLLLLLPTALHAAPQTSQPGYNLNFTLGTLGGDMLQFTGPNLEVDGGLRKTKTTR